MNAWRFTTEELPKAQRQSAWRDAMERICLPIASVNAELSGFSGSLSCVASPMGIEFARVSSTPQTIAGRFPKQQAAVWLTALLEGEAIVDTPKRQMTLGPGSILVGRTGAAAAMRFTKPFTQLFVKAPAVALSPRLISPNIIDLTSMTGATAAERMFFSLLSSAASVMDDLTTIQLRPVELSVTEFLITCLSQESISTRSGSVAVRAGRLHRICQTIESMLADPSLSPERVATEHGVSERYLQKLFAETGSTFGLYVRKRRLERCHADLASPICAQMSISEICFRWGFNGSAHFSRAFRDEYGVSPREHRRAAITIN
ncbi:MAG: helix-turn-helix domain-containing protein [Caulobacterales bacterium]